MADEVDTRISPTLHPDVSLQIEDYDEETRPLLGQTETAVSMTFEALKAIHDAKAAAATNPTLNEFAQLVQVDDFATKRMSPVMKAWDSAIGALNNNVVSLEKELNAPVKALASGTVAAEVRAAIKLLDVGKRMAVLQKAINDGDEAVATAVLGAPAMLSGIDPELQDSYRREWHERQKPVEAKKVRAMKAAADLLNGRVRLLKKAHTDAVGTHDEFKEDRQGRRILAKRWTPEEVREMVRNANLPFAVPVAR